MYNVHVFFKAKACEFNGISGYMLRQYIDGKLVLEQFVAEVIVFWIQNILRFPIEIE